VYTKLLKHIVHRTWYCHTTKSYTLTGIL